MKLELGTRFCYCSVIKDEFINEAMVIRLKNGKLSILCLYDDDDMDDFSILPKLRTDGYDSIKQLEKVFVEKYGSFRRYEVTYEEDTFTDENYKQAKYM